MTATYAFDVLCTLDGFDSYGPPDVWELLGQARPRVVMPCLEQ
jgi:hypothetical protein